MVPEPLPCPGALSPAVYFNEPVAPLLSEIFQWSVPCRRLICCNAVPYLQGRFFGERVLLLRCTTARFFRDSQTSPISGCPFFPLGPRRLSLYVHGNCCPVALRIRSRNQAPLWCLCGVYHRVSSWVGYGCPQPGRHFRSKPVCFVRLHWLKSRTVIDGVSQVPNSMIL